MRDVITALAPVPSGHAAEGEALAVRAVATVTTLDGTSLRANSQIFVSLVGWTFTIRGCRGFPLMCAVDS